MGTDSYLSAVYKQCQRTVYVLFTGVQPRLFINSVCAIASAAEGGFWTRCCVSSIQLVLDSTLSKPISVHEPLANKLGIPISCPVDLSTIGLGVDLFTQFPPTPPLLFLFSTQPSLEWPWNFEGWILIHRKPVGLVDRQRKASKYKKMMHWSQSSSKHCLLKVNTLWTMEYHNLSLSNAYSLSL